MQLKDMIVEAYSKEAEIYDESRYGDKYPSNVRLREVIKKVLDKYLIGDTVFQLACGTGYWEKYLEDKGFRCKGIDLSEGMLAKAREKGLDVKLGDVEDIMNYPKEVDNIICIKAFTFFQEPVKVLRNINSSLRKGGRFICFYNNKRNLLLWIYSWFKDPKVISPQPPYTTRYSWREFLRMLKEANLEKILIKDCVNLPYRFMPPLVRKWKVTNFLDEHLRFGWTTYIIAEKRS